MRNIRMEIAYDGTNYAGWQKQPPEKGRTIQGELERALSSLCGHPVQVQGAGRTDAGVHAACQTASFHTTCPIPAGHLPLALGGLLPDDIVVGRACDVPPDWHARYLATGKHYRYLLVLRPHSAFNYRYATFLPREYDWELLRAGAELFLGRHDFASFRATGTLVRSTWREVFSFTLKEAKDTDDVQAWQRLGRFWYFDVCGSGFLYKQVRLMVGALLSLGRGRCSLADIATALEKPGGIIAPPAPACGLTLMSVFYDSDISPVDRGQPGDII